MMFKIKGVVKCRKLLLFDYEGESFMWTCPLTKVSLHLICVRIWTETHFLPEQSLFEKDLDMVTSKPAPSVIVDRMTWWGIVKLDTQFIPNLLQDTYRCQKIKVRYAGSCSPWQGKPRPDLNNKWEPISSSQGSW